MQAGDGKYMGDAARARLRGKVAVQNAHIPREQGIGKIGGVLLHVRLQAVIQRAVQKQKDVPRFARDQVLRGRRRVADPGRKVIERIAVPARRRRIPPDRCRENDDIARTHLFAREGELHLSRLPFAVKVQSGEGDGGIAVLHGGALHRAGDGVLPLRPAGGKTFVGKIHSARADEGKEKKDAERDRRAVQGKGRQQKEQEEHKKHNSCGAAFAEDKGSIAKESCEHPDGGNEQRAQIEPL